MSLFYALLVGVLFALGDAAAVANASYIGNCTSHAKTVTYLSDTPYINSSATVTFDVQHIGSVSDGKPWYYYMTLTQSNGQPLTLYWLGVPESIVERDAFNYTRICTYLLEDEKGRSTSPEGNKSCNGIISNQCVETFLKPKSSSSSLDGCPGRFDMEPCNSNHLAYSCGLLLLAHSMRRVYFLTSSEADTLSREKTCFSKTMPGITLPEGYVVAALGGHGGNADAGDGEYAAYDDSFRRINPAVIVFYKHEQKGTNETLATALGTQSLCAAPNKVQPGSRSGSGQRFELKLAVLVVLGALFWI
ncbi:hypothetical protein PWT90_01182 [Aphanocladium album]|nr:hypothetical protein PWT90_01182 [Aphanocladium album]